MTDQCWLDASWELPQMHTDVFEDFDDFLEFEISDTVLAFTEDGQIVTAKCSLNAQGNPVWFNDDGTEFTVTHWMYLPNKPKREDVGECE
jgi:hypothetical protein